MALASAQKRTMPISRAGSINTDRRLCMRGANCMPAGRFFFLNMAGGLLGVSLRLRCLRSGDEIYKISGTRSVISLGLFINAECDLVGPIYRGGICTLNFNSTK